MYIYIIIIIIINGVYTVNHFSLCKHARSFHQNPAY